VWVWWKWIWICEGIFVIDFVRGEMIDDWYVRMMIVEIDDLMKLCWMHMMMKLVWLFEWGLLCLMIDLWNDGMWNQNRNLGKGKFKGRNREGRKGIDDVVCEAGIGGIRELEWIDWQQKQGL